MVALEILYLLSAFTVGSFASLRCLDDFGDPVDWWVMYKLPSKVFTDLESGLSYVYITRNDYHDGYWKLSNKTMENPKNMFHRTVEPYFRKDATDQLFVFYNDQIPGKGKKMKAHAKGVLGGNNSGGFWIIHSIPNFIEKGGLKYEFPKSGRVYGQIAVCISFRQKVIHDIANQLVRARVNVYLKSNLKIVKYLELLTTGRYSLHHEFKICEITTNEGALVTHYSKPPNERIDLISRISKNLKKSLDIQSWTNGKGVQSSDCTDIEHLKNIVSIKIKFLNDNKIEEVSWRTSKDHSKWLVSSDRGTNDLCIGDLNRMESQVRRGGGMICFKDSGLWSVFKSIINETEPCEITSMINTLAR